LPPATGFPAAGVVAVVEVLVVAVVAAVVVCAWVVVWAAVLVAVVVLVVEAAAVLEVVVELLLPQPVKTNITTITIANDTSVIFFIRLYPPLSDLQTRLFSPEMVDYADIDPPPFTLKPGVTISQMRQFVAYFTVIKKTESQASIPIVHHIFHKFENRLSVEATISNWI